MSSPIDVEVSSPPSLVPPTPRGIPSAIFIPDVSSYLLTQSSPLNDCEGLLKHLNELYGKYKFMESQLITQQRNLLAKVPDIQSALEAVIHLQKNKNNENDTPLSCTFELSSSVFAEAEIDSSVSTVALWLGANVMLEYSYDEAIELLTKNLANAKKNLFSLQNEIEFLKDQITIQEVNVARVHNHNIQIKQKEKEHIMGNKQGAEKKLIEG